MIFFGGGKHLWVIVNLFCLFRIVCKDLLVCQFYFYMVVIFVNGLWDIVCCVCGFGCCVWRHGHVFWRHSDRALQRFMLVVFFFFLPMWRALMNDTYVQKYFVKPQLNDLTR